MKGGSPLGSGLIFTRYFEAANLVELTHKVDLNRQGTGMLRHCLDSPTGNTVFWRF